MTSGVYNRTKSSWNKGLSKFSDHRVLKNTENMIKTKHDRYKQYQNWEKEYGKEKAQEMMQKLYDFTYGRESSEKVKENLRSMSKNIIDEFINLESRSNSEKEINEIYLIKKYIALIRDEFTCQICGSKHKYLVHHIIARKLLKNPHTPNNMITLCISCHTRLENILGLLYYGQSRRKIDNLEDYLKNKYKIPLEKAKWLKENLIDNVEKYLQQISFPLETTRSTPEIGDDIVRYSGIDKAEE